MFNKLKIIGNGFDIHHKLDTKWIDFKIYVGKSDPDLVGEIDGLLDELKYDKSNIVNWKDLESIMGGLTKIDFEDLFNEIFENSEYNPCKAAYYGDPQYNARVQKEFYNKINDSRKYFASWIVSIDLSKVNKSKYVDILSNEFIINFNYTKTIEEIYGVCDNLIWHVHGEVKNNNFVLGHNEDRNVPFYNPNISVIDFGRRGEMNIEEEDFRVIQTRSIINELYEDLYTKNHKNSKEIITKNIKKFNYLQNIEYLEIMGFGFGKYDLIYLNKIVEKLADNCEIKIYYHTDNDYDAGYKFFSNIKRNATYIRW